MRTRVIKFLALSMGFSVLSFLAFAPLVAQTTGSMSGSTTDEYLKNIMINTYGILERVNTLPASLDSLTKLAISWMSDDESDETANLQTQFSTLGNAIQTQMTSILNTQSKVVPDLFQDIPPASIQNANDMTYQTALGMPFFKNDPRNKPNQKPTFTPDYNVYAFLKNASGLGYKQELPNYSGSGSANAKLQYANYYASVMSIKSYDAYLLSSLYADFVNGGNLTKLQSDLVSQATGSDWFKAVASERIGIVLRQILLYQSQTFVMITQLLQSQKQALAAQAMTNTLLILLNQATEQNLFLKASGNFPST